MSRIKPVAIVFALVAILIALICISQSGQIPFDSDEWKDALTDFRNGLRYRMKDDLLKLINSRNDWDHDAIVNLLGRPQGEQKGYPALIYVLGSRHIGPFEREGYVLVLKINPDGSVSTSVEREDS